MEQDKIELVNSFQAFLDEHQKIVAERDRLKQTLSRIMEHHQQIAELIRSVLTQVTPHPKLLESIDQLEVGVRSYNVLKNSNICSTLDLVRRTEDDLLKTPNSSRKVLTEVKEVLVGLNLRLGMSEEEILLWRPKG